MKKTIRLRGENYGGSKLLVALFAHLIDMKTGKGNPSKIARAGNIRRKGNININSLA